MAYSEDIYKDFVSVIKPVTGFKVVQAFINDFVEDNNKKFVNQIVITPPSLPANNYSFDTTSYKGDSSIVIEIYASTMKNAVLAYDIVFNKILSNRNNFMVTIDNIGDAESTSVNAGGSNIYIFTIPVYFKFDFDITEV